jgi:hypothetical protein
MIEKLMKRHKIHIDTLFIDEALFINALIKISICAKFDIGIFSVDIVEGIFFSVGDLPESDMYIFRF